MHASEFVCMCGTGEGGSLTPVPDTQRIHVTLHGLRWHAAYCAYYYLMYKLLLHLPVRARFLPVGLCKNACVCVFMCVSASLVAVVAVHMRNKYTLSLLMAAVLLHTLSVPKRAQESGVVYSSTIPL